MSFRAIHVKPGIENISSSKQKEEVKWWKCEEYLDTEVILNCIFSSFKIEKYETTPLPN